MSNINILCINSGLAVKALENDPAFLNTDEYLIIEHKKYELIDNKIHYNGLEYELIDENLLVAYDLEGIANILSLPLEKYRIKDKEKMNELNNSVASSDDRQKAIPSSTVNLPYTKKLADNVSSVISPTVNVNVPGSTFYRVLSLKITGLVWNAPKNFDVRGIHGDVAENWYDLPIFRNHNFGTNNTVKWQNFTSTRCVTLIFCNLAGETGYTYTINRSTFCL